jgi:hypothetical protein
MAYDPVRNFCKVIVNGLYDSTATTIQLALGEGNKLPDPSTEGQYNLVWWNATDYSDPSDDPYKEIVRVTAKSGDQITILRGQEGTTAQNHNLPGKTYKMMLTLTKKTYEDLQTIEVYKDGTLVGQRARFNFLNFPDISDDATNQIINLNLGNFRLEDRLGDGSDGDFTASTGTTTFDLQNKMLFVKNFNNFSLTGNAAINFSNPNSKGTVIIFRVKGTATITSTATPAIDVSGLGANGGSPQSNGLNGLGLYFSYVLDSKGGGAGPNGNTVYGTPATGIESLANNLSQFPLLKTFAVCVGGGGGGGGTSGGSFTPGSGGKGGGVFILIANSLTFSSSIYANGDNGTNASGTSSSTAAAGGGGGGGGGSIVILAKTISSLSGTFQSKGGNGGNGRAVYVSGGIVYAGGGAGGGSASDSGQNGIYYVPSGFTLTVSVAAGANGSDASPNGLMGKGGQGGAGGYVLISTF